MATDTSCLNHTDNTRSTMIVARWVTDGEVDCTIGRLSPVYKSETDRIHGRLGQVVQDFSLSHSKSKTTASAANDGILLVALIDNYCEGDEILNSYLIDIDSNSE